MHESSVITAAEQQSALATTGAAEAIMRAGIANDKAIEAQKQTARSRLEQERLRRGNLLLQSQVEKERTERLRLDEKYGPRTLSVVQRELIVSALKTSGSSPDVSVKVVAYVGGDCEPFAKELMAAINDPRTGWRSGTLEIRPSGGQYKGVMFAVPLDRTVTGGMAVLKTALESAGIGSTVGYDPALSSGSWFIFVGPKN